MRSTARAAPFLVFESPALLRSLRVAISSARQLPPSSLDLSPSRRASSSQLRGPLQVSLSPTSTPSPHVTRRDKDTNYLDEILVLRSQLLLLALEQLYLRFIVRDRVSIVNFLDKLSFFAKRFLIRLFDVHRCRSSRSQIFL